MKLYIKPLFLVVAILSTINAKIPIIFYPPDFQGSIALNFKKQSSNIFLETISIAPDQKSKPYELAESTKLDEVLITFENKQFTISSNSFESSIFNDIPPVVTISSCLKFVKPFVEDNYLYLHGFYVKMKLPEELIAILSSSNNQLQKINTAPAPIKRSWLKPFVIGSSILVVALGILSAFKTGLIRNLWNSFKQNNSCKLKPTNDTNSFLPIAEIF